MYSLADTVRNELNVRADIDVAAEVEMRVQFLVDYAQKAGANGFVLGISGGQDSTLAGRLCQLAADRINGSGGSAQFVAVLLPYGVQADQADVDTAIDYIKPSRTISVNIKDTADAAAKATAAALEIDELTDLVRGNVKARERMIVQYAVAGQLNLIVVGTDHAAEAVTGFFTKYGDGGADVVPLSGLTKGQGAALLEHLGAPESLWTKVPTADLEDDRPAIPDEEALGVSYSEIDAYLTGEAVSDEAAETIEQAFVKTRHKRTVPVAPTDLWWRDSPA
jgi:NAD+ synthase